MYDDLTYKPRFQKEDVELLTTKSIYKGFVQVESVTLRHRLFATQNFGQIISREIVRRREAAGVFVYDPKIRKFLLIEQFRASAMDSLDTPWQLEIIAGLIDAGEDAETCLKREAIEEAGCHIQQLQFIHRYYPSTGASDEIFNFYAATANLQHCGGIHGEEDEGEDIQVHLFDFDAIPTLFASGYVRNAPLIIALQWFQLHLAQQKDIHRTD